MVRIELDYDLYGDEARCRCPKCGGDGIIEGDKVYWGRYLPRTYDNPDEYEYDGTLFQCADCGKEYVIRI